MRLATAFRAFFAALAGGATEQALREVLESPERGRLPAPEAAPPTEKPPKPERPPRSDALSVLSTLQREARFIDLVKEPLDHFSDAQVGAAARPCLQQCAKTLDRLFGFEPLLEQPEGESMDLPTDYSPLRFQLLGGTAAEGQDGSQQVRIIHPGWKATRCQVPEWTGKQEDALVVTPAQVEPKG